ncbi:MAG: transcriptional regulator, LuxR family [Geminicoccaceae bacterium]|nr:transcriptional regulator, LuxR family [Geminicoccaceae bacterium]
MESLTAAMAGIGGTSGAPNSRSAPLLVGRTLEQFFLREELAAVCAGRGRLVLLGGEAGIGKTTLARDLVAEAGARRVRALTGACYDLTNTPPYGPWLDLFDACASDQDLPPPPAAFASGRLERVTDQAALFTEVRTFFRALADTGPALILLEDLHWADPASLELLRHLAPRLRHWPILLLVTYRGDELTRRHPFAVQLPALVREAEGLRLDLQRLDAAALRALVAARYRLLADDEARLVAYLEQHAEGNPLFATELLRALQEEMLLRPADDSWTLGTLDRVVLPFFLRHVIDHRIARLGETTRMPLAMAAVIGQDVPLDLWAEVAGLDDETLLTIVERAVDAHLLEADRDGECVRFVHTLTREALYESVLPPRRRMWHRRVGKAVAAHARPDPDAVAYHFQAAGDPRACDWLIAAGDRAQRTYAWLTAAERLRAAASLLEEAAGQERTRGRLACRVAYLLRFSDPDCAIEALDIAARVATQIDDAVMAAEVRWLRGLLLCYTDRFRSGLAEMMAGIEALKAISPAPAGEPAVIQAWLNDALPAATSIADAKVARGAAELDAADVVAWRGAALGRFLANAGRLRTAVDGCEHCVAVLADVPEARGGLRAAVAFASHGLGIAEAGLGRPEEARTTFAQARAIFAELDHHALVAFTLLDELRDVALTFGAADPAARRRIATEAEAALGRTGGALRPGVSPRLAWLGCLVLDGQWDEVDRILYDLLGPGNAYFRREITAAKTVLARHRGDPDRAWEEIRRLLPAGPETEPGDLIHQEGLFLQRLAADLCLDEGDVSTAHAWLAAHDRWLAWSESVLGRAEGQVIWARWHQAAGDTGRARAALDDALTRAAAPSQPVVSLATHRLLGEIATAAGHRRMAAEHLAAALDLATVCDAPFERALTLLSLSQLHLVTGATDAVAPLLGEVRDICGPLGAAPTLARVDALAARLTPESSAPSYPAGLTPREVDVLRLLPRGLSNAEIAEALFVSPRTIQSHLSNLYGKLAVGGRAGAIAYAVSHGLV